MHSNACRWIARLSLAAAFLLPNPAIAGAQAPAATTAQPAPGATLKPSPFQGAILFGGAINDNSGAPDQVSEYDVFREGALPKLGALLWGDTGKLRLDARLQYGGDQRDQAYVTDLNYARWLKAHARYTRMPHRLEHDPLSYVDSASGIGGTFVVGHTDTDPAAHYAVTRGEFVGRLEIAPPAIPALRLFVAHRQETREGNRQSLTASHCATCHVVAYSRGVDEGTRDISAGARLLLKRVNLDYSYLNRRFTEDQADITHTYLAGVHPATLADVFLNRLQYDARSGALPFDLTPSSRKGTHVVRGRIALPRDASLTGTFTRSDVENSDTSVGYSFTGGTGRLVVPMGSQLVFRGSYRTYEIDADDVFVDIVEQVSPAGPTAGLTYAQAYPTFGNPDFVRESALSRTPTDFGVDLTWTPLKRTSVQAGYEREALERTSFDVEKTTTDTFTLRARARPWKQFETRTRFESRRVTDPFMYEHSAIPAVLQPFMSPGNVPFTGLQYYEMYGSRQADLTSYPTRSTRLDQTVNWSPSPRVSVSGHYRLTASDNDDLNFSTWSRNLQATGAELWIAPGERWSLMAGYSLHRERLETMFSTLAFVG